MTDTGHPHADAFALRHALDEARLARDTLHAEADQQWVSARGWRGRLAEFDNGASPTGWAQGLTEANVREHEQLQASLRARLATLDSAVLAAEAALRGHLAAAEPLFADDDLAPTPTSIGARGTPIALLPVRLETVFRDATHLDVRVYPDDLMVDGLDRRLTTTERDAARQYWADPTEAAWQALTARLRPNRAGWAAWATRPGAPEPATRGDDEASAPVVTGLPDRWRFLGITGEVTVVDAVGAPIPTPISLDLTTAAGAWLLDFDLAVECGMAARLELPPGIDRLDRLLVVGVSPADAATAAERLDGLFESHLFTDGFAFLPAGTPTNNTPESRSAWSSAPHPPRPPAAGDPAPATTGSAATLAGALGLDAASPTGLADQADDTSAEAARTMARLSWGLCRQGLVMGLAPVASEYVPPTFAWDTIPAGVWRTLGEHVAGHVRSRGTLPSVRIGRQPYGVLPVTSLDEWVPDSVNPHPWPGLHARELLGQPVLPAAEGLAWARRLLDVYRARQARDPSAQGHSDLGYALHVLADRYGRRRAELLDPARPGSLTPDEFDRALHDAARESVREYLIAYRMDPAPRSIARAHLPSVIGYLPAGERQAAVDEMTAIETTASGGGA